MKKMSNIFKIVFMLLFISACTEDEIRDLSFLNTIDLPTNVSAMYNITQDNTGLVTITPVGEGVSSYDIHFGDSTTEPENVVQGNSVEHTYAEGTYTVTIVAYNLNGQSVEFTQELIVSFQAPQNLVVMIENDEAISKQVNVTANADFATTFDFYPGDATNLPITGNIGETISYTYQEAGIYTIIVEAKGGAIETTMHTEEFEVTEILAPIAAAPTPPTRNDGDVISIYSSAYTDVAGTDTFPDWGQAGQGSSWATYDLNGDSILQYINLSYQGVQIGAPQDVSGMEFIHLDVWTPDEGLQLETSLISLTNGEKPVVSDLTANEWTSLDIPISAFTDQGLTVADIHQLKFVGIPWATGTVFIDNIYFHRAPTSIVTNGIQDFEGTAPSFTAFGNASAAVVTNPDMTVPNTTSNVAEFIKPTGAETWAGAFFDITTPIDVTNFNKIIIKTLSPKSGATVRLKIENSADNTQFFEVDAVTTIANAWEDLTFDISSAQNFIYDRVVIFFDFGNVGDDSTYYYDEIISVNDSGTISPLIFQDFEGVAPAFTVFGNAGSGVIVNPDMSGVNTTSNSAEFVKPTGAETWAGSFFDVTTPLDLNTYSKMIIKSLSTKSGATVRLKIENSADNTQFFEIDATTSSSSGWEELSFDLSAAQSFTYDRVVIFFDFGNTGDDTTYYYDEFTLTN